MKQDRKGIPNYKESVLTGVQKLRAKEKKRCIF